ncbi:MAG TPA: YebC/PmpR family DNA-binding transcriptional regulator, partial [Pelolinea sp.]|nr:YebC/PmpR family DNA-binding transcriptional regulator [Pelolinea sp.]
TYEAYASNGVALMVDCLTENRNRTVAELRHALTRCGGNTAEVGSVSWQFNHMCFFSIPAEGVNFDKVFEVAVENGADDISSDEGLIEIYGPVDSFKDLSDALKQAGFEPDEAGLRYLPKQEISLDIEKTLKVMNAIDAIEELDDVQDVYSNLEISEEALASLEEA